MVKETEIEVGEFKTVEFEPISGDMPGNDLLVVLTLLSKVKDLKRLLEIGTFRGITAQNIAINFPEVHILTTDIPSDVKPLIPFSPGDSYPNRENKLYTAPNIRQLWCDSSRLYDMILQAVVLVDGGHSYEQCLVDSVLALQSLRPKDGLIIWHDYTEIDGVTRAVNLLSQNLEIFHVKNTHVAFCWAPNDLSKM
jgi:hypothetical protein